MKYILLIHHEEVLDENERKDLLAESVQLANQLHAKHQYVTPPCIRPRQRSVLAFATVNDL